MEPEPLEREQFLNQVSALRKQGLTVRAIAAQLGIHPSRAQRALQALQQRAGIYPAPERGVPPNSGMPARNSFIGRQREMGELKAALEGARAGQGRLAMLVGEPGIGKTRIAQELAANAERTGVQVLWGRCYEGEGAPPCWPWVQLLRSYIQQQDPEQLRSQMGPGAADIAEIIPEVREKFPGLATPPTLELEQARFRLFDSITTFLKNASQAQPLLLVLDDLHWADKPSLLLLQFLARQSNQSRLLVVGCYRDVELSRQHPLSEALAELSRERVFQRHLLQGLSREDTQEFIESAVGVSPSPGLVQAIHGHTEGNPFFMSELVRLLRDQGTFSGEVLSGPMTSRIPEGVREVIGQRLNRRSEQCYEVLTVASVIGREFSLEQLGLLSEGLPEERLLEVVEEALAARIIEEVAGAATSYRFCHALIQETLVSELSAARRVRLHARIGEALEELYGLETERHAAELAYHFGQAGSILEPEKVVKYSLLAGEQALAAYAWDEGLAHFQRGLRAKGVALEGGEPASDAQAAALLFGLGRTQSGTVDRLQLRQAIDNLHRAFDYYVQAGDVTRAVAVAEHPYFFSVGTTTGMAQLIARALELAPPDSNQAGRLLSRYGYVLGIEEAEQQGAQDAFSRALAIAHKNQDAGLELRTLAEAARVERYQRRFGESLKNSLRAIDLARRVDDLRSEVAVRYEAAVALEVLGDPEASRRHATELLALSQRLRDRTWLSTAYYQLASLSSAQGDWGTARSFGDCGLAVLPKDYRTLSRLSLLEFETGNFVQGEAYLERLLEVMRLHSPGPSSPYMYPAIVIPAASRITGDTSRLEVGVGTARTVLASPSVTYVVATFARFGLALAAAQRGDVSAAREQYPMVEPERGTMLLGGLGATDRLLGLLAQTMEQLDEAVAHFEDALAFCQKAGYRPELAWTCCDYAGALLARNGPGDHNRAISLLEEAGAISSELGMRPLLDRVSALQQKVGSGSGDSPIAPTYPHGLTQREAEVLKLVATGKTDREIAEELIISVSTVSTHVRNLLNKTGTSNRTEAAAYASQRGLI